MTRFKSKCVGKSRNSCSKTRKCKVANGRTRSYCRSKKNRPRYKDKVRTLRRRSIYVN